ncbi:Heavy-metal-associated domain protein [Quillaja saponaria]|uniref:Heavy-metal-associated domain protein n=1 Tax=Quillaja saponaria TaxID=32244 RepID=A0AAD7QGA6_QUISA|nr:Heavy-metal-associated domain protein [Quillaja saponaria]
MKGIDFFCASPASTAVISSRSSRPHHHDKRKSQLQHVPCSSHLLIDPKFYYYEKYRKKQNNDDHQRRRKSSADSNELYTYPPPGSSNRYLLGDTPFIDWVSESEPISAIVPAKQPAKTKNVPDPNDSPAVKSSSSTRSHDQVVVLRASLHCKGCEGKVRKHISKMEGVTSFSIDLERKRVTIIGDVTPLGVLESMSKVKNAQLWPSPSSSSSSWSRSLSTPSSQWSA